jgi:hypothetical protein
LALFQGRIIDMPEQPRMESQYSSGGDVAHEVTFGLAITRPPLLMQFIQIIMVGGILFLVIELNLYLETRGNNRAQLFLELLCEHPYKINLV